jgi:hypothetical protein
MGDRRSSEEVDSDVEVRPHSAIHREGEEAEEEGSIEGEDAGDDLDDGPASNATIEFARITKASNPPFFCKSTHNFAEYTIN